MKGNIGYEKLGNSRVRSLDSRRRQVDVGRVPLIVVTPKIPVSCRQVWASLGVEEALLVRIDGKHINPPRSPAAYWEKRTQDRI